MSIKLRAPEVQELKPRIAVLGVGGAGGNAVNNMITAKLEGVSFFVANTDAQALALSQAERKIQLGAKLTEGLGAGAKPEVGRGAAEESLPEILNYLSDAHMVFITAGMGGGTGTGAAPVIARAVREQGILTVGVVTKPFHFEGDKRMKVAEYGIEEMQNYVDTLIVIPNQNLFRIANERTTFAQAFSMADEVLHCGVRGITDLIVMPGLINRDFADIKTVMSEMGKAMMGTGEMGGDGRALRAAEAAISNPLLDDVSMKGARAVLVNVTGGADLMLFEVDEAVNRIRAEVDPDANILFGSALSENMEGKVRVSVVATGIEAEDCLRATPDNVQRLHPRRKAADIDTPVPITPVARTFEPVAAASPVHMHVENLTQEFGPRVEVAPKPAALTNAQPVAETHASSRDEEPLALGGSDMPIVEDHSSQSAQSLREFTRVQPEPPPEREKRRGFSLFGGRRRSEKAERHEQHQVEPSLETPRAVGPQRAPMPPAASRVQMTAAEPVLPTAPQAVQPTARQGAEPMRPQQGKAPEDLFADMERDDAFEIPAFLRRQNTGT
jgi:cell division protein FtsZ